LLIYRGAHGGKKKSKKFSPLLTRQLGAQSQGDVPGFAKSEDEKAFAKDLMDWLVFHESMLIGETDSLPGSILEGES